MSYKFILRLTMIKHYISNYIYVQNYKINYVFTCILTSKQEELIMKNFYTCIFSLKYMQHDFVIFVE